MKRNREIVFWVTALMMIVWSPMIGAQTISLTGDWALTIDAANLQSGPGSDLVSQYPSDVDQIQVRIADTNQGWIVSVRGQVYNWHSDMSVHVRRRSDGIGPGWISGGENWLQVTLTDQQFFQGWRRRRGINIQCGLTGVSVQIPPELYSGSIIYTVTAN